MLLNTLKTEKLKTHKAGFFNANPGLNKYTYNNACSYVNIREIRNIKN